MTGALRRVGRFVADDWRCVGRALRGGDGALPTGLHTYRQVFTDGEIRVHLRFAPDGGGLLFVDVTDVIHLNPTAARIAHLLLEGTPPEQVPRLLAREFRNLPQTQVRHDIEQIRQLIATLTDPAITCRTCATSLQRNPLFSTRAQAPYKADIAVTYACNNECPHCYNEPDRFDLASLPLGEWRRVIDVLHAVGVPHLIFTGGEATLHPDLPEMIAYADGRGHICGLNTNGRRIAHAPYACELKDAGLNHVQVTLESHHADVHNAMVGANAFHQTVRGIEGALAAGLHTITNTTLTRRNRDDIEATIDFLHALGVRTFAMNGMIYSGGGFGNHDAIPEEQLPALLIRVRDHAAERGMRFLWYTPTEYCRMSPVELEIGAKRCNAGEYSICIEPNGDVLPCQSFYVAAGNILRDSWETIWRSDLFVSFRHRTEDPQGYGLPEKCWDCIDLPLCGGGCRIEREARDGVTPAQSCTGCAGCGTRPQAATVTSPSGFIPLEAVARSGRRSSATVPAARKEVAMR